MATTSIDRSKLPVASLAILYICLLTNTGFAAEVVVGVAPPDYLGKSVRGEAIRITDQIGRLQIISFWASWCEPCLKELPVLNAIQNQVGADRMRVVAINLKERRTQFLRAMRAFGELDITIIHDKKGTSGELYDVTGIPFLVILDVDGKVAFMHSGYKEEELPVIVDEINGLLIKNQLVGDVR